MPGYCSSEAPVNFVRILIRSLELLNHRSSSIECASAAAKAAPAIGPNLKARALLYYSRGCSMLTVRQPASPHTERHAVW